MLKKIVALKKKWKREADAEARDDLESNGSNGIVWGLGLSALVILLSVLWPYRFVFNGPLSTLSSDWANFGTYVGGAAGPPLAFISIVALLITIRQQAYSAGLAEKKAREEEHLRALSGYISDLERLEATVMVTGITLGDVLSGFKVPVDLECEQIDVRFSRALRMFVDTLFRYSEMVAMHRSNNRPLWDLTFYKNRGLWALESLEPFQGRLNPLVLVAIRHHLEDSWPESA